MTIARIPLAHPIASRTASTSKDSRSVNAMFETSGGERRVVKRPGLIKQNFGLPVATGRGLFTWDNDIIVAQETELYRVTGSTPSLLGSLTGTLPLSFVETAADAYLALHDGASFYYVDKATKTFTAPSGAVSAVHIDTPGGYYGYATDCTVTSGATTTITKTGHGLVDGQGIAFNATTMPAGLTAGTPYQVVYVDANTFTVNTVTTGGGVGSAVATTTNGTDVKYSAAPVVTFSAGTVTAKGTATLYNHQVSGVIITVAGTYTAPPTVTFSAPAAGTQAVLLFSSSLDPSRTYRQVFHNFPSDFGNAGAGYISPPTITFPVSSLGQTASGYTSLNAAGEVSSYTITNAGLYTSAELPTGDGYTATVSAPPNQTALGTVVMASGGITGPFAYGMEYLDGYVFILTKAGRIYQSDLEDPTTWGALNYIEVNADPDSAVALTRQLNYLVAFGEWSTEVFYNAGNPTDSILGNNKSAKMEIGCASGPSVAKAEHTVVWMGQSKTEGRAIYLMEGLSPIKVSNRYIEKYLNASNLSEVYSYCFKLAGHTLYLLTLADLDITFVYDLDEKEWYQWSGLFTVSSYLNLSNTPNDIAMNFTAGLGSDRIPKVGDEVSVKDISAGSLTITLQEEKVYYIQSITYDAFTYDKITLAEYPGGPAIAFGPSGQTGIATLTLCREEYFPYTAFNGNIEYASALYMQHQNDGQVYVMSPDATADDTDNIYFRVVTNIQDSGTTKRKFYIRAEIVGDKVAGNAQIRHTSDDYQTWSTYRTVVLSDKRPILYQLGESRRRAWEILITDNIPVRLDALELDFDVGEIGAS